MSSLGDHFPQHTRQEYVSRHLKPGQVLYLYSTFTTLPKEKYLILAHQSTRPLLFVINSQIGPFIANRPALLKCQVKLSASDYDFLDHDSFANCGQVIDYFTESEIENQVIADVRRVKGELTLATRRGIVRVVEKAKMIANRHKRLIIESLKP